MFDFQGFPGRGVVQLYHFRAFLWMMSSWLRVASEAFIQARQECSMILLTWVLLSLALPLASSLFTSLRSAQIQLDYRCWTDGWFVILLSMERPRTSICSPSLILVFPKKRSVQDGFLFLDRIIALDLLGSKVTFQSTAHFLMFFNSLCWEATTLGPFDDVTSAKMWNVDGSRWS